MVYRLSNAGTVHAVAFRLLHFVETYVSAFPRRKLGLSRKSILENDVVGFDVDLTGKSYLWMFIYVHYACTISLLEFNLLYLSVFFFFFLQKLWTYFIYTLNLIFYPIFRLLSLLFRRNFICIIFDIMRLSKDLFYSNIFSISKELDIIYFIFSLFEYSDCWIIRSVPRSIVR